MDDSTLYKQIQIKIEDSYTLPIFLFHSKQLSIHISQTKKYMCIQKKEKILYITGKRISARKTIII